MELAHEIRVVGADDKRGVLPTLIFAHGAGFCRQIWNGVLNELESCGTNLSFRAALIDMRSHGQSRDENGEKLFWDQMFMDVRKTIDVIASCDPSGSGELVGVGHSLGATTLLFLEAQSPGLFSSLVVAEPIPLDESLKQGAVLDPKLIELTRKRKSQWRDLTEAAAYVNRVYRSWDYRARNGYIQGALRVYRDSVVLRCPPMMEMTIYQQNRITSESINFSLLECPITVLQGEKSKTTLSCIMISQMQKVLPNIQVVVAAGAGHDIPMETPAVFLLPIQSAIERLSAGFRSATSKL
ncbi:hypothetical protein NDN08_004953 [Rhodosorus marinus]|uniref:AB hydrolase-1 domain-containing protein n=1 Tax=Rhodosorus marinus TaxID=101924 RepID=A0AAV8UHT9_9RHOD|nr:hypothetical protein NDN08_004953 [Rhodosorus marinus]